MKFISFSLLLLLLAVSVGESQTTGKNITIGTIDSVYSKVLKEKREIWVHAPNTEPASIYSNKAGYPVVYLLDGPDHFTFVTGMIRQLSGSTICPDMILVGIPNTDRTRDLTPTHVSAGPSVDSNSARTSGGGEAFTQFLEKELIPHIDSLYATKPYRMLIGHSLGGLLVINTLINHPGLFNSYVAIDPSMWWDDQRLLKQAERVLQQTSFDGKALFLGVANTMEPGMDTLQVRKDTARSTAHIRSILYLNDLLNSNRHNGLRWSSKYYHEEDHGTVPLLTEYDALHFVFSGYRVPSFAQLNDSTFDSMSAIVGHFEKVSKQLGYTVLPPEPLVNQLGYTFLQNRMFSKARMFFEMNVANYPESFNVYDSMGDYYAANAETQKAIEYYSKALSLRDYPQTRQKMEKLKGTK